MKKCQSCGTPKDKSEFYSGRKKCKLCYNSERSKKYNEDPVFRGERSRQIQQRKYRLRKEDPEYYLRFRISQLLRCSFRREGQSKKLLTEYGIDVASIFSSIGPKPEGDFHLDHILPQHVFDYNDLFQVWACNHAKNLRWLPGKENSQKRGYFQQGDLDTYLLKMKSEWGERC
jgi:hypothetical protein